MKRPRTQAPPASRARPGAILAELIGTDTAQALDVTVRGYAPVLKLCRVLLELGRDPASPLHANRGKVLCLKVRSIGEAARLELNSKGTNFVSRGAVRIGPPVAAALAAVRQMQLAADDTRRAPRTRRAGPAPTHRNAKPPRHVEPPSGSRRRRT